jgi:hypothetical protein
MPHFWVIGGYCGGSWRRTGNCRKLARSSATNDQRARRAGSGSGRIFPRLCHGNRPRLSGQRPGRRAGQNSSSAGPAFPVRRYSAGIRPVPRRRAPAARCRTRGRRARLAQTRPAGDLERYIVAAQARSAGFGRAQPQANRMHRNIRCIHRAKNGPAAGCPAYTGTVAFQVPGHKFGRSGGERVSDRGPGVPAEQRQQICLRLSLPRVPATRTRGKDSHDGGACCR